MLPFKNLILIDRTSSVAVYKQITDRLIGLIQEGKLLPGTELPSTRALAADLNLHRNTVIAAYEKLVAENWITSISRKGYVVSSTLPLVRPRTYQSNRMAPFEAEPGFAFREMDRFVYQAPIYKKSEIIIDDGFPDISLFPAEDMLKEYKRALDYSTLKKITSDWDLEGNLDFRSAMCDFLNQTRGLDIEAKNLLSTRGAQMAIYLAASLIIQPGDKVIVSEPGYFFANWAFERFGAELIYVPVDDEGMCTEMVEVLLRKHLVKMLYVVPHHHHPTTVTMSVSRRSQLLELIRTYELAVIEDDYDYDFQFQNHPYLPLASGDHGGNIIYIGSLTKVIGTPFRLGYMVAAERFIRAAAKFRTLIDLKGDVFMEQVVSGLVNNGSLKRLIQKANKLYRQRCHFLHYLLVEKFGDKIELKKPDGGMALWLKFRSDFPLAKIIGTASTMGLRFGGSVYAHGDAARHNAFRFGFASLNQAELEKAVEILQKSTRIMV